MSGFTILSPALEKEVEVLYVDDSISLATQLALKFREQTRVFVNYKDKSTIIALINGEHIHDHQLRPKEEIATSVEPERNKPNDTVAIFGFLVSRDGPDE